MIQGIKKGRKRIDPQKCNTLEETRLQCRTVHQDKEKDPEMISSSIYSLVQSALSVSLTLEQQYQQLVQGYYPSGYGPLDSWALNGVASFETSPQGIITISPPSTGTLVSVPSGWYVSSATKIATTVYPEEVSESSKKEDG